MANNGATAQQMATMFNWKDPKMATEYVAQSKPTLKRNASLLTGVQFEDKRAKIDVIESPDDEIEPAQAKTKPGPSKRIFEKMSLENCNVTINYNSSSNSQ